MSPTAVYPRITTIDSLGGIDVERDSLLGTLFGIFTYGIHITLYIICMISFYSNRKSNSNKLYMAYITFNFILGSIGNAFNTLLGVQAFVEDQNFPGGPAAFIANVDDFFVTQICVIVYSINTWSQDGLLLYRFYVLFGESLTAIALPFCSFTVSIIFSCLLVARLIAGDPARAQKTLRFGIVFWSISIGTTICLTSLIVAKLVIMRIRVRKAMDSNLRTPYLSVSATFMESACLYSILGVIYLVLYAKGNLAQYLLLPAFGQAGSIAPLLIAWRVSQRRAWTSDTLQVTTTTNVVFYTGGESSEVTSGDSFAPVVSIPSNATK